MTDYRDDITTLDAMYASLAAGEKYQMVHGSVFLEMAERLMDLESTVSKLAELAHPRRRGILP